jgi:hypothetical protein
MTRSPDSQSPESGCNAPLAAKGGTEMNAEYQPAGERSGRRRPGYREPRGAESTREMRDTARRRRDAEEKLQQHLLEAKGHVPNERRGHRGPGGGRE